MRHILVHNIDISQQIRWAIVPSKWHEMERGMVSDAMNRDYVRFQKEHVRKEGTIFPIEITGWIIKDASGARQSARAPL